MKPSSSLRAARSRFASSLRGRAAFTLIETAMALGILGISLAALMDGTLLSTTGKLDVRNVSRATLVARSVMAEIEQKLMRDGFGAFETTAGCDFRIEGLKEFHCEYQVRKVELPIGDMIQRLMTVGGGGLGNAVSGLAGGLTGGSTSGSSGSSTPSSPMGGLGALAGGPGGLSGLMGGAAGGLMGGGGGAGLAGNAMQLYASQMEAMLEEALREVRLTLSWKVGRKKWDSMTVVTHVVEIGRAGVTAQDQLSGQISKAGGLQAPVPGQAGAIPGMPGGFTGTAPPMPGIVSPYVPGGAK